MGKQNTGIKKKTKKYFETAHNSTVVNSEVGLLPQTSVETFVGSSQGQVSATTRMEVPPPSTVYREKVALVEHDKHTTLSSGEADTLQADELYSPTLRENISNVIVKDFSSAGQNIQSLNQPFLGDSNMS